MPVLKFLHRNQILQRMIATKEMTKKMISFQTYVKVQDGYHACVR